MHVLFDRTRPLRVPPYRGVLQMVGLLIVSAVLFFSTSVSATVMTFVDLVSLIEQADVIVHGHVSDRQTYFDKERGFVVTDTTLRVETAFHGAPDRTVTFQQWGGQYEDRTYHIPGDPGFEVGEEVIVFLARSEQVKSRLHLVALSQSKYRITRNEAGHTLVMRDMSDVSILFDEPEGTRIGHVVEPSTAFAYFIAELEALVAGIKGGQP